MSAMDWTSDSDSGIYKNNFISNKLLHSAVAECRVAQFARPAPGVNGLFRHKGESVDIMHINELPNAASALLEEGTDIPIDKVSFGNRPVTLKSHGRGVEYTDLAQQFGKFDLKQELQGALKRQMTRALDTNCADAFQSTDVKICFIPTSLTGGTFDVDGTPSTIATANLNFDHMGVLSDYLGGDIHCPPFEGDDYIMLSCRKSLRGLKQSELWQLIHMYLQKGDLFFKSEAGKAENIRAVQVDREEAISNTAGVSTVLGNAIVFGGEAVGYVETTPPQLYADPNFQSSFGLTKAMCWHGIYTYFSVWNVSDDGKARIIRITSA